MYLCPNCNRTSLETEPTSYKELEAVRRKSLYSIHKGNSWWLTQPLFVAQKLRELCIVPKKLFDLGCGDGRWIPGLTEIFPEMHYTGMDAMEDMIANCIQDYPERTFYYGDFTYGLYKEESDKYTHDVYLLAGVFNPKMLEYKQRDLLERVKEFHPKWIICLFDLNQTGKPPDKYINDNYSKTHTIEIPKNEQNYPRQNCVVWVYKLNVPRT